MTEPREIEVFGLIQGAQPVRMADFRAHTHPSEQPTGTELHPMATQPLGFADWISDRAVIQHEPNEQGQHGTTPQTTPFSEADRNTEAQIAADVAELAALLG